MLMVANREQILKIKLFPQVLSSLEVNLSACSAIKKTTEIFQLVERNVEYLQPQWWNTAP